MGGGEAGGAGNLAARVTKEGLQQRGEVRTRRPPLPGFELLPRPGPAQSQRFGCQQRSESEGENPMEDWGETFANTAHHKEGCAFARFLA